MSGTQEFSTEAVLTATTGIMLTHDIGDLYDVLGYVLGDDSLMTHQLPAAARAAEQHLYRLHPWLRAVHPPRGDTAALRPWLDGIIAERGDAVAVTPDPEAALLTGNSLQDLADIADGRAIIAVKKQ
jgi:hypothetical protein